jgi:hypothetical protein
MYERINSWAITHPKTWCCTGPAAFGVFVFFVWWAQGESWYSALGGAAVSTAIGVVIAFAIIRLHQPRTRPRSRGFLRQGFGRGPQR